MLAITREQLQEIYEKTYGDEFARFPYDEGSLWRLADALNHFLAQKEASSPC